MKYERICQYIVVNLISLQQNYKKNSGVNLGIFHYALLCLCTWFKVENLLVPSVVQDQPFQGQKYDYWITPSKGHLGPQYHKGTHCN